MYIDGKNVLKINNRVSAKFIPVNFWFPTRQTYLAPTDLLIFWTFSKRQTYLGRHDYSELRSNYVEWSLQTFNQISRKNKSYLISWRTLAKNMLLFMPVAGVYILPPYFFLFPYPDFSSFFPSLFLRHCGQEARPLNWGILDTSSLLYLKMSIFYI